MFKSKLQIFIIAIILILVLVLAYFGYEISNQNNQQAGNILQRETERIREEVIQDLSDYNNQNKINEESILDSIQERSSQKPTTEYQESFSPDINLEQENVRENSTQNSSTEINLKKINSLENLSPEMRVVYDRTLGRGLLKQENKNYYRSDLYFVESKEGLFFLGRGVILIEDLKNKNENYRFIISQDLFGTAELYFTNNNFNRIEKAELPFKKIVRGVEVKENSTEVIFKLADGNGRNVTITERKINILDLLNQPNIQI